MIFTETDVIGTKPTDTPVALDTDPAIMVASAWRMTIAGGV
jgi:hypothetical protein